MKSKGWIVLMGACLLFISAAAGASDYKDWIPLLPEGLGGLQKSGKPEGMNMEMDDQRWSMVQQEYTSDSSEESINLILVGGQGAPQIAGFQTMSSMKMETEEQIVKTVEVFEYKGLLNLEKNEQRGTLMIALTETMMVVIEAAPITEEGELMKLAQDVPLSKLAAEAK
jgi:hypothetical protein